MPTELPAGWHYHDGALSVMHDLVGDRAHRQRAEAAAAAAPDYQQVAALRRLNQRLGGEAVLCDHAHGRWLAITEISCDLGDGGFGQFAGLGHSLVVARHRDRPPGPVTSDDGVHCDDSQIAVPHSCLGHRPLECVTGVVRPVDAYHNPGHVTLSFWATVRSARSSPDGPAGDRNGGRAIRLKGSRPLVPRLVSAQGSRATSLRPLCTRPRPSPGEDDDGHTDDREYGLQGLEPDPREFDGLEAD